ncbi:MAG: S41 family peptidase [Calditrichaeota bacterium]|nr:S41 family peptidase [Calditrichota bacterium]
MNQNHDTATSRSKKYKVRVIVIILMLTTGIWVSAKLLPAAGNLVSEARKITAIMRLIQQAYVEDPDLSRLSEGAIEGMLKRLDPHSVYITPKKQQEFSERDMGEFEGIGISFVIQNELITVISPITGTPSERLGIHSGDRIVEIDGVSAYGITNDEVFKKLRGPKGTEVSIKVIREGLSEPLDFTIVRDKIPIKSVWSSFMLDDSTGYVMLNQFMATSTTELEDALRKLENFGMTRLIFDLRNNQGGRLSEAVSVADKFIPGGHTIVSRLGRTEKENQVYESSSEATHPMFNLIVLINDGSASASEIVSGAIQDLDRGLIVGTRTFGKGLVQYPYQLNDGGVIRLSTAHWYTARGRLIQRPYDKGRGEYYAIRYKDPDEVKESEDREVFKTLGGREVFQFNGIEPDIEVEPGTITGATARLRSERIIFNYAEEFKKKHDLTDKLNFQEFMHAFTITDDDLIGLIELASEKDITYPEEALEKDGDYLKRQIKSDLAQLIWNNQDYYYMVFTASDRVVKRAMELFDKAEEISAIWH